MENNTSQEQRLAEIERKAWEQTAKDKVSVAEKYAKKFGTTDGEATDNEVDELMKRFQTY